MKYQLKTLKDVFDKVPADKICDCLNELAVAMVQAKAIQGLFDVVSENKVANADWPETVEWVDNGKKEISLSYRNSDDNDEILRVETKLSKSDDL